MNHVCNVNWADIDEHQIYSKVEKWRTDPTMFRGSGVLLKSECGSNDDEYVFPQRYFPKVLV